MCNTDRITIVSESVFIEKDSEITRIDLKKEGIRKIAIDIVNRRTTTKTICTIEVKQQMPHIDFLCNFLYSTIDANTLRLVVRINR